MVKIEVLWEGAMSDVKRFEDLIAWQKARVLNLPASSQA
jgi:hypothetical protein